MSLCPLPLPSLLGIDLELKEMLDEVVKLLSLLLLLCLCSGEEFLTGGTYYPIKEGHACSLSMINLIGATYLYFTEIDREPYLYLLPILY